MAQICPEEEKERLLIEYMKPDFEFGNEKGTLTQLVHDGWRQVNVISSVKGSIRGGHYHKYNQECFFVITGGFILKVWDSNGSEETYRMHAGDLFMVKPEVYHTFEYTDDTLLVSMYSRGVELDETTKDIWTE